MRRATPSCSKGGSKLLKSAVGPAYRVLGDPGREVVAQYVASNTDFAVAIQVYTSTFELIYFNQAEISYNVGLHLKDTYPVCVFCAEPASADAQFACAALLHITSAI